MKTLLHVSNWSVSDRQAEIEKIGRSLLNFIGEDPERQGLKDTPERFAKSMGFMTSGYGTKIEDEVGDAIFDQASGDLVLIKDIEFYSLCEHHMLPFFGKAHVAYIPNGKVIGLSKIPRIVNVLARRLQVQERLTHEIATALDRILKPKGVAVIIEASHLCMMMRGVEKQLSKTVTKSTIGDFRSNSELRSEFLNLLTR